jgi:hypothetical protein
MEECEVTHVRWAPGIVSITPASDEWQDDLACTCTSLELVPKKGLALKVYQLYAELTDPIS